MSRDAKENYYNVFSRVAKDSSPCFEEDSVVRVSTSFPCSISHIGENLHDLVAGERAVPDHQSETFTNVKWDPPSQKSEIFTNNYSEAPRNQYCERKPTINQSTESSLAKDNPVFDVKEEEEGQSEFSRNKPKNSQSEDENLKPVIDNLCESEYVVYSNGTDPKSWHSSYVYLSLIHI